jgi:hypothetical protein
MVDGVGVGSLVGMRAADAASGPPAKMLVGAYASTVCTGLPRPQGMTSPRHSASRFHVRASP